jgi:hypothetical protein
MPEFDTNAALQKSTPKTLAAFLAAGDDAARLWRPEELAAIFRHQMAAPIVVDLGGFDPATASRLKTISSAQGLLLKSFHDLFSHKLPPRELLIVAKDFAKANMDHPGSSLPAEVSAVLYYGAIAAALVRLDERISQLSNESLKRGFSWAGEQPWVETEIKQLLAEAAKKLP